MFTGIKEVFTIILFILSSNWVVYGAIIGETLLACFLTYTPGVNTAMSYMPIK